MMYLNRQAVLGSLAKAAFVGQNHIDSKLCLQLPLALFVIACTQCARRCPARASYHNVSHRYDKVQKDVVQLRTLLPSPPAPPPTHTHIVSDVLFWTHHHC